VLGAGAQSLTLIRVLSTWFERRRGLAIGACMAGYGVGYVLVPLLTQALITAWGWRAAYVGLGALAVFGALPVIAMLLHDSPAALGLPPGDGTEVRQALDGPATPAPALAEALRTRAFWLLAVSFVLMSAALNGVQAQIVPLLTDRGLSVAGAALMLSAIGLGSFPARLLVGFLLDRVFAPYLAAACFGLAALALAWLIGASAPLGIALVAIAVGLALGAENDILGYLTGRYFSLACFGRVYGALLGAYLLGAAAGPYVMARAYALAGDYTPALRGGVAAISIACVLLFLLPRYVVGDSREARTR
jgi:sugar phosphate permease